jgi:hypothetical protein
MIDSNPLLLSPANWLRAYWPMAICGIAVGIGALGGYFRGLALTRASESPDGPLGTSDGTIVTLSVAAGAAVGLALIAMPLAAIMALRFRGILHAARRKTQQRLNQEMAAAIERTRRGPAESA